MAFLINPQNNAPILSPDAIARRRKVSDAYLTASRDTAPIQSWTQGAAKLADALIGGLQARKADEMERGGREGANASVAKLVAAMTGTRPTVNPGTPPVPAAGAGGAALKVGNDVGLGDIFGVAQNPFLSDAQGGIVSALLKQKMDAAQPKDPIKLGAGDTLYDPGTMKPLFTAPTTDTVKPISVGEGSMLYDPVAKTWIKPPPDFATAFRPATPEEKSDYGVPAETPLVIGKNGEPKILSAGGVNVTNNLGPSGIDYGDPPKDMAWARTPDGKVALEADPKSGALRPRAVPIAGGPLEMAADEAAAKAAQSKNIADTGANVVVQDVDRALARVKENPGGTTGIGGMLLKNIPATQAFDTAALISTIKANAAFDKLQAMRAASPTGGALGNVSDAEGALLAAAIGNLDPAQSAEQFTDNLKRVKNIYLDIIHGKANGPPREVLGFDQAAPPADPAIDDLIKKYGG